MRIELKGSLRSSVVLGEMLGARHVGVECDLMGITTDSREVKTGDLFVALDGKRVSGASFLTDALSAGAGALLVQQGIVVPDGTTALYVRDVERALLDAARAHREQSGSLVIAVSGSAGKTTVKEGIAAMLAERFSVQHSKGNFNSTVGAPLSLLSMQAGKVWVLELGINHIGEMERLARAVSPDIAVLTNAEHAHVGLFGDRKTLVREKLTIARELRSGGHLILPIQLQSERLPCPREQCIAFGRGGEFAAENIRNSENAVALDLRTPFRVITNLTWPLPGEIGVAVVEILGAVGALCGLEDDEIRKGILRAGERPLRQRAQVLAGRLIVDDCYNASPEATVRALETLTLRAGDRALVAVLGDMLELGDESEYWHVLVGKRVAALGFSKLFVYGTLSPMIAKGAIEAGMAEQSVRVFSMAEQVDLVDAICRECPPNAAILFKASGAMCMGRVLGAVKEEWA